jgi:hypothetical protein
MNFVLERTVDYMTFLKKQNQGLLLEKGDEQQGKFHPDQPGVVLRPTNLRTSTPVSSRPTWCSMSLHQSMHFYYPNIIQANLW